MTDYEKALRAALRIGVEMRLMQKRYFGLPMGAEKNEALRHAKRLEQDFDRAADRVLTASEGK